MIRSKQELLNEYHILEVKADHYNRSDWEAYTRVMADLKNLDNLLLDMLNEENETFLQSHKGNYE